MAQVTPFLVKDGDDDGNNDDVEVSAIVERRPTPGGGLEDVRELLSISCRGVGPRL